MMMKKFSLKAIVLLVLVISVVSYKNRRKNSIVRDDTVFLVGTSDDYPPYTFNQNGKIVGFDIDLARAVAEFLGKKFVIQNMSFSVLLLDLDRDVVQMIAAGISPRKTAINVLYTDPYITGDPFLVITRSDSFSDESIPETIKELFGKKVAVNEGYTSDFYISRYPQIELVRLETVAECILALKTKKVDFFVVAQTVMQPFFELNVLTDFKQKVLQDLFESYAFVVSGKNSVLFDDVQRALKALKENGTVDLLKKKWKLS